MKIPQIIKPFAWRIFKAMRKEDGFKIKTFPEGFRMNLDMSEVIDNNLYYGIYEPETIQIFRKLIKPGMTVVDVGANIGYFTLLSADIAQNSGEVLSFEPTTKAFNRLNQNIVINNFKNINHTQLALSNFNGEKKDKIRSSYKIIDPLDFNNKENWNNYAEEENFMFITLDSLKLRGLDFMKIDVDGGEVEVLEGAIKTINKYMPIIIIEINGENFDKVAKLLKGYSIGHIKDNNYLCQRK